VRRRYEVSKMVSAQIRYEDAVRSCVPVTCTVQTAAAPPAPAWSTRQATSPEHAAGGQLQASRRGADTRWSRQDRDAGGWRRPGAGAMEMSSGLCLRRMWVSAV
jgi:hypothetical protein